MLIKTFCETFKKYPQNNKPALIIKTSLVGYSKPDKFQIQNRLQMIRTQQNMPHIYLLHGQLSQIEMNSLYNHPKVKTMITYTHGQGYGLPIAQFATTGKPIIAPNYGGYLDFIDQSNSTLLTGKMQQIHPSVV